MAIQIKDLDQLKKMRYGDRALKGGMKAADKSGAHFSLVLGENELASGQAQIKNMKTGESTSVTIRTLQDELFTHLKKATGR